VITGNQIRLQGFRLAALLCLILAVLKLTVMVHWSWWRVLLPLWVLASHNVGYVLIGFLCLSLVSRGEDVEDEEVPTTVEDSRLLAYNAAAMACFVVFTDNLLRWLERGGNSYWFWLCSGKPGIVLLFGVMGLATQWMYWSGIVRQLDQRHTRA